MPRKNEGCLILSRPGQHLLLGQKSLEFLLRYQVSLKVFGNHGQILRESEVPGEAAGGGGRCPGSK